MRKFKLDEKDFKIAISMFEDSTNIPRVMAQKNKNVGVCRDFLESLDVGVIKILDTNKILNDDNNTRYGRNFYITSLLKRQSKKIEGKKFKIGCISEIIFVKRIF